MTKRLTRGAAEGTWESWGERADTRGGAEWINLIGRGLTDSEGLSLGIARVRPGEELALHRHREPEVYYVLRGEASVEIDGEEERVSAGTAVFIPANASHACRNRGSEELRFLFGFPVDTADDVVYDFAAEPPGD